MLWSKGHLIYIHPVILQHGRGPQPDIGYFYIFMFKKLSFKSNYDYLQDHDALDMVSEWAFMVLRK